MDVSLQNDMLSATVSTVGAELQSVLCGGVERIWSGDPSVWHRRAPLLFPFVGRLRNGFYEHEGARIDAPMHGFCRDREFELADASATQASFVTASDDETRAVFPFDFRLTVSFELNENSLIKRHVVENTGNAPMPFELGGHEAYATRLLPGEHMSSYYVQFEDAAAIEMFGMDEQGILYLPKTTVELEDGRLARTPEQLGIDTIILEDVPNGRVSLASTCNALKTTVDMGDFPYMGIWTMDGQADARYLCIEPWSALPDAHFSPREIARRAGVITLAPGEKRSLAYTMTFE